MACYHLTLKFMSRKGGAGASGQSAVHGAAYRSGNRGAAVTVGGVSAVAAAAYRSGQVIHDERTGLTYDYRNKDAILHTEIVLPAGPHPEWATDRNRLWNQVEKAEKRKDATVAREVEVMLPRELDMGQQLALVRRFIAQEVTAKGLVADFAIHRPDAADGEPHPHCHIMITPRALEAEGFAARKDDTFRWSGKGEKSKDALVALRAAWAELQNDALADAGSDAKVDHRSLAAQREEALSLAEMAHATGRAEEAAHQAQRAEELNRIPQVPLGLGRRVREVSGYLKERLNRWAAQRHYARLWPQVEALERRGVAQLVEIAHHLIDRAAHALGADPPAPEPDGRGLAYER